ncbi:MAG: Lrp/AsnC family transcriptional regulator [Promethearchaeota archaeon]
MLRNHNNIDEIDRRIIEILQANPSISHSEIGKRINKSQPTIGMRLRKLEESGIFKYQAGINLKSFDLALVRIDLETTDPVMIEKIVNQCPFMINVLRLSGVFNLSILMVGFTLKELEKIINCHFRKNPKVNKLVMNVITDVPNDFIIPLNFDFEGCCCLDNKCQNKFCEK